MKVLLISANRSEINMRAMPLGMAFVAESARRAGHEVKTVDLAGIHDVAAPLKEAIEGFGPRVIGISIRNIDDQTMHDTRFLYEDDRDVISRVRSLSPAPIVLGGAGYSMFPGEILADSEADMGIEGEGEAAFVMLLERIEKGLSAEGLPGVHVKGGRRAAPRQLIRDIRQSPLPDPRSMVDTVTRDDAWVPVQTRRGCAMDCSYCSTSSIEGRILRKRPVRDVVEWLARLAELGARQFYFVDNTFNLPPSYALSLCEAMDDGSLNARFRCILYPLRLDERLVSAMARAGCVEASIGSESADNDVLSLMNKRYRRKDVEDACRLLKQYGIRQLGFLMLGAPGDTRRSIEETLAFTDSLDLAMVKVTVGIRVYPGTRLAEEAIRDGILSPGDSLLKPRFYLTPGLDEEWVRHRVAHYAKGRPNWITG